MTSTTHTIGGTMDAAITPTTVSLSRRRRKWTAGPALARTLGAFVEHVQSGSSHPAWSSSSEAQFSLLPACERDRLLDRGYRYSRSGG
jgi:hypothetical protein